MFIYQLTKSNLFFIGTSIRCRTEKQTASALAWTLRDLDHFLTQLQIFEKSYNLTDNKITNLIAENLDNLFEFHDSGKNDL